MRFLIVSLLLISFDLCFASLPVPWQTTLQIAATPVMERLTQFHNVLLYVIFGIAGFVFCLLTYTCLRFRKKVNPIPSSTTHNTKLEILWTIIPVIIVIAIAIPSIKVLYYVDKTSSADLTLKVVGHQWYWEYEYPDSPKIKFDSYIIKDQDLKPGQHRLLEVDNEVVLPINKNVKLLVTGADVMHSWAVPAFGIKVDAVPGKVNESWFRINKPGIYYGQCSELCGIGHGFMPIAVRAVEEEEYKIWLEQAKTKFGGE